MRFRRPRALDPPLRGRSKQIVVCPPVALSRALGARQADASRAGRGRRKRGGVRGADMPLHSRRSVVEMLSMALFSPFVSGEGVGAAQAAHTEGSSQNSGTGCRGPRRGTASRTAPPSCKRRGKSHRPPDEPNHAHNGAVRGVVEGVDGDVFVLARDVVVLQASSHIHGGCGVGYVLHQCVL